jgi:predicted anti-sigma-YlaC factor YlaD
MKPTSADCQQFQDRLADFIDRQLLPEEHTAAEEHLRFCQRCRGLLRIAEGKMELLSQKERNELSEAILAQTSGTVCGRARELMSDHMEGSSGTLDRQLLEQHMEHCSSCRTIFETIQHLLPVLAEMGELEPGKIFTRDVIRATSRVPGMEPGWLERFRRWWSDQLAKPIVQWEAAYVGALLLVATFGTPGSPLKGLPLHVVASFHRAAITLIPGRPLEQVSSEIVSLGEEAWNATGGRVIRVKETLGHEINDRQQRIEPHLEAFERHAEFFGDAVMERDVVQAALHLGEMQSDLQRIWRDVRHGDAPTSNEDGTERGEERPPPTVTS